MRKCCNCGKTGSKRPCIYCGWPPLPDDKETRICPNCGHIGCHNICPACKWHLPKLIKPKKVKPKQPAYIAEGKRRNRARERYAEKKRQAI